MRAPDITSHPPFADLARTSQKITVTGVTSQHYHIIVIVSHYMSSPVDFNPSLCHYPHFDPTKEIREHMTLKSPLQSSSLSAIAAAIPSMAPLLHGGFILGPNAFDVLVASLPAAPQFAPRHTDCDVNPAPAAAVALPVMREP
jgi:hypothetical protein